MENIKKIKNIQKYLNVHLVPIYILFLILSPLQLHHHSLCLVHLAPCMETLVCRFPD